MNNSVFYDKSKIPATEPISIAWSGGIDSTFALKWLLENTEHPIYAYFFAMKSPTIFEQIRIDIELKACTDMLAELKSIRDFQFEVLSADFPFATARVASLASIVQQVNFRRNVYNIFIGVTSEEASQTVKTDNPDEPELNVLSLSYEFTDSIARAWEDFTRSADKAYKLQNKKRVYTRLLVLPQDILNTKFEYVKYLGLSLVEKTFTCANTQWLLTNNTPCGVCVRCIDRQESITKLKNETV